MLTCRVVVLLANHMLPPVSCGPRLRNAATTREAILVSARSHFARESYENVGLRDIARDVGVDPALVSRYFGGKEQLFKEALRGDNQLLVEGIAPEALPAHLASLLMEGKDAEQAAAKVDCVLTMLHSASSPQASQIVREALSEDVLEPMASLLTGEDAALRASMTLAVLMGFSILRSAMAAEPMCRADSEVLRRRLTALFTAALADSDAD